MAITKDNLIAITNQVIVEEMPHNIRMTQWELGRISEAIIEKVTEELAKDLVSKFGTKNMLIINRKKDVTKLEEQVSK